MAPLQNLVQSCRHHEVRHHQYSTVVYQHMHVIGRKTIASYIRSYNYSKMRITYVAHIATIATMYINCIYVVIAVYSVEFSYYVANYHSYVATSILSVNG